MKVLVLESFHIYEATLPGQPERKVSFGKGMVLPDVADDVAEVWIRNGHVRSVEPQAAQTAPIAEPEAAPPALPAVSAAEMAAAAPADAEPSPETRGG